MMSVLHSVVYRVLHSFLDDDIPTFFMLWLTPHLFADVAQYLYTYDITVDAQDNDACDDARDYAHDDA